MLEKLRSVWRDIRGSALVEATVLLPLLFTLVFGVFEFSWYFYDQHRVSTGVRDAARYLSRVTDPTDATLQSNAKNLAVTGSISGGAARVMGWTMGSVKVNVASIQNPVQNDGSRLYRGEATIQIVTVTTTFGYSSLGFIGLLRLTAPGISVAHSERVVGPG
jgi:Flp pilus assembly protein TadG